MSRKPALTVEKVQECLVDYINHLTYDEIKNLLSILKVSKTPADLPIKLQQQLNLMAHRIPKNLTHVVETHLKAKIPELFSSGKILKTAKAEAAELLTLVKRKELSYSSFINDIKSYSDRTSVGFYDDNTQIQSGYFATGGPSHQEYLHDINKLTEELASKRESYSKTSQDFCEYLLDSTLLKKWRRPASITFEVVDGQHVLNIRSTVIVLSKCLEDIENALTKNIHQVVFVADEVMYIDCCLENKNWHGINILVLAKKLDCVPVEPELKWDLSGLDGNGNYSLKDNNDLPEVHNGNKGSDGTPGQSGGHVLFLAKEFVRSHYLKIISNGGRGQDGQNGEDGISGMDGTDGAEMGFDIFRQSFPNSGNFLCPIGNTGIENINFTLIAAFINAEAAYFAETTYPGDLITRTEKCQQLNLKLMATLKSFFLEGVTKHNIKFSVVFWKSFLNEEAIVLFKGAPGSLGTSGRDGSFGGIGGQGGYPGSATALQIDQARAQLCSMFKVDANRGEDGKSGENGKNGDDGVNGKDGRDHGYMYLKKRPNFFEKKENLEIVTLAKKSGRSDKIWSVKHKMYISIDEKHKLHQHDENANYTNKPRLDEQKRQPNKGRDHIILAVPNPNIDRNISLKLYEQYILGDDIDDAIQNHNVEWWIIKLVGEIDT